MLIKEGTKLKDFLFLPIAVLIATAITYIAYKILLDIGNDNKELQISSEEIHQQMKLLMKEKKYDIVEKLAKNYLKNKGFCHEVRALLAKSYFESGNYEDAISNMKYVIKYQPKNIENRIFLANCYRTMKKPDEAIDIFMDILNIEPTNVWVMKNIAILYLETNQKFAAIRMYEKISEFSDNKNEVMEVKMILADLYASTDDTDNAIRCYLEILDMFPYDIMTKMSLCEIYQRIEDYDSLIDLASNIEACALDSKDALLAQQKLLIAFMETKNYEKALEVAQRINDNPVSDKVKARDDIAKILVELDRIAESIQIWNNLITEVPTSDNLKKNLVTAYIRQHDFDTAVYLYKTMIDIASPYKVLELNAELSVVYAKWGLYLFNEGKIDECFEKFSTAIGYYSENPEIFYQLGLIDKEINNYKEALGNFKKALELDDSKTEYYYEIAECYEAMDSVYDQKKYLSESLKIDDTNPKIYYKLSLNYQRQNDLNSAISNMEKAVYLDATFIDAKIKLALMYEHVGKIEEATALYEDILKIAPENEEVLNNLNMLGNE